MRKGFFFFFVLIKYLQAPFNLDLFAYLRLHAPDQYALSLIVPHWDTTGPGGSLSMMQHLAINNVL